MSRDVLLSSALMTPRTNIAEQSPLITRSPLLESQALDTEIASYNTTPKAYDDSITAAAGIAGIVRKTLNYRSFIDQVEPLTPKSIAETEEANCHGYVAVLSECLNKAELDHFICFANGHSFVLIGDPESKRYTMVDPITRKYNGDITEAIEGEDIYEQFIRRSSAATRLHTDTMLHLRGLTSRTSELTGKNQWISHERPHTSWRWERPADTYTLQMKVLTSARGRALLVHYTNAMIQLNNKDSDGATEEIAAMQGFYPDMDPRNRFELARRARSLAFKQGKWGNAMVIADVIHESSKKGTAHPARFFRPDTLRKIGNLTGISELLEYAVEGYADIPGDSLKKKGKIRKTQEQQGRARAIERA